MTRLLTIGAVLASLLLAGCATVPSGPTWQALPGSRKTFEQFQIDDADCRNYATAAIGGTTPSDRANQAAVGSAVAGTAIGAAAGALIGGTHDAAGVGAGIGLITGSMIGADQAYGSYHASQRRYDVAYHQCMYARGHKVPVYGRYAQRTPRAPAVPPPSAPPPKPAPPYGLPANPAPKPPANLPPSAIPPPDAPPPS
jgi:hypothetical protein